MKKHFLVFCLVLLPTTICADDYQMKEGNPYTLAIRTHMGPKKQMDKKIPNLELIAQKTDSLVPQLHLIEAYAATGQLGKILNLLQKNPKLNDLLIKYPQTGLIVVKTLSRLGQNEDAVKLLLKINDKNPTDPEVTLVAAQFYERRNELHNALKVINDYLNKSPKKTTNFAFLLLKKRIYLKLGDKEKALDSIEQALQMQPHFDAGWLMFAQMQEAKGQIESAIKGYSNYLELSSSKKKNFAGNMLFKAIEGKLLQLMFNQIMKKQPGIEPTEQQKFKDKIINMLRQKKYKGALEELDKKLSARGGTDTEKLLKIQALGALEQFDKAAEQLQAWMLEDPNNKLWFETLHLLYFAGLDSRKIITILKTVEKTHKNSLQATLYLGDMLTRNFQYQEAVAYHNKSLKLTEDPVLQTSILFQLGFLHYELGQHKKMKIVLERGRALGLEYAPLLNLLAYYYASYEKNPKKAEPLIKTVLQQEPDNPHFLDTQALIYYRQEKYVKALALLEKIVKQEPDDATILKHLAKTYEKLGMPNQAVAHMQRVINLTYDKKKKKKYEQLAQSWKKKAHDKKQNLLCCR